MRYIYQYFDQEDFEEPIKSFIEDKVFMPLVTGSKKGVELHIKKNSVTLNDGI